MKIISKHWDFYDSCGPWEETEPVYVRSSEYFNRDQVPQKFSEAFEKYFKQFDRTFYSLRWAKAPFAIYVGIYPYVYPISYQRKDWYDSPADINIGFNNPHWTFTQKCYEATELFRTLNVPVFVYSPRDNAVFDKHHIKYGAPCCCSLIKNSILQNTLPCVLGWIDADPLETYNNIENFLWSTRTESVKEPDNRIKILAHGFDLKNSFRKVK